MKMRQAGQDDLKNIVNIIDRARVKLQERGIPQWQDGDGPSEAILRQDIIRGDCYVLEQDTPETVVGIGVLTAVPEQAYEAITEGNWVTDDRGYLSIHRVAIAPEHYGNGYAKLLLQLLVQKARSMGYNDIRIDTHPKNQIMQRSVAAVGFIKRGNIILDSPNGERIAYQYEQNQKRG